MSLYNQKLDEGESGFLFKTIIVGEQSKSSLLMQYTKNCFKDDYNVTIGLEFASKQIIIDPDYPPLTMQIWDTAGQESFKSIVRSFYRQAAAAFLVYNITSRKSFLALNGWLQEIRDNGHEDIVITVIGNQYDCPEKRQVQYEEGIKFMNNNNLDMFFETSAKTNYNVEKAFMEVTKLVNIKFIKNKSFSSHMNSQSPSKQDNQDLLMVNQPQVDPPQENDRKEPAIVLNRNSVEQESKFKMKQKKCC